MATTYFSDACQRGIPLRSGLSDTMVRFTFTYAVTVVVNDLVALAWIPEGAVITDWVCDMTVKTGTSGTTVALQDLTTGSANYMAAAASDTAIKFNSYVNGVVGACPSAVYASIVGATLSTQTPFAFTGFTTAPGGIPPSAADVFHLKIINATGATTNASFTGWLRYTFNI